MIKRISFGRRGPRQPAGWTILLAGVVSLVAASYWYHSATVAREIRSRQRAEEVATLEARQKAAQLAAQRPEAIADRERLTRASVESQRPWLNALALIEREVQAPTFLLSVSLDGVSSQLRLDLESNDLSDAVGLVQRLQGEKQLQDVMLASHQQAQLPDGRSVLRYVLTAKLAASQGGR